MKNNKIQKKIDEIFSIGKMSKQRKVYLSFFLFFLCCFFAGWFVYCQFFVIDFFILTGGLFYWSTIFLSIFILALTIVCYFILLGFLSKLKIVKDDLFNYFSILLVCFLLFFGYIIASKSFLVVFYEVNPITSLGRWDKVFLFGKVQYISDDIFFVDIYNVESRPLDFRRVFSKNTDELDQNRSVYLMVNEKTYLPKKQISLGENIIFVATRTSRTDFLAEGLARANK